MQATAIDGLVDLTADPELDGINVDVESLAVADILAYGAFVGRLREALRERVKTGQVSVATASGLRGAGMAAVATEAAPTGCS